MRLRHIEVFHAVYVTGSVSAAARALNVSQPSVSKVLRHAEDTLGFSLFQRAHGRLFPTDKAKALFAEVEPIFKSLSDLRRFSAHLAADRGEHIRFAMTPSFATELGPAAIAAFADKAPNVTLDVQTLPADQIAQAVIDETIDIGLVFDAPLQPGINVTHLAQTEFICAGQAGWCGPQTTDALPTENLEGHPLIMLNESSVLGQTLARKLSAAFAGPLDARIMVETNFMAKQLVRQGAGIAIIDAITARSGDNADLDFRTLSPAILIQVDVVTRQNLPETPTQAAFIAELNIVANRIEQG